MTDAPELPEQIRARAMDYLASAAKAALGAVPFAGSLLAEIAGSIIPRQRLDRLADFAAKLEDRIRHLETETIGDHMNDEEFTDLVEEALRQTARSTTEDRRAYLASLVATSLSSEAIKHAESKYLMRLLGELTDVEVLWLRFFYDPTVGSDQEFVELHKDVFDPIDAHFGSSREELDAHALQESYQEHLVSLGLVTPRISKARDGTPEFDWSTGNFKASYHEASPLGRLLLRRIGMVEEES